MPKSSEKTIQRINTDDVEVRYSHIIKVLTDWIDTTNLITSAGRGMAKSTVIQARRSADCVYDMPGAALAFAANTYTNLTDNIMPAVKTGWELMGLYEGVHYTSNKRPPESWRKRCSIIVDDYKNTISFWNGSIIFLGSLDHPSLLADKSVVHLFFDEAKYDQDKKVNRAMPILRGDAIRYGHSHYFLGVTITTDMPDVLEGEYDWYFRYVKLMKPERILKIVQAAGELNELRIKLVREENKESPSPDKLRRIKKKIIYYEAALLKMRKGESCFINASSFTNIDILTIGYIKQLFNGTLELHEFKKSVVGMRPGLRRDIRFYVAFSEKHKYTDGVYHGEPAVNSRDLRFLHHDNPIDAGVDFGNQLSLIIGQEDGAYYRLHKNFFELPPNWFRELADQFLGFFLNHEEKELNLYYDRAGNNFEKQKEDYARKLKEAIEIDGEGNRTGWIVNLMSRKQANIRQDEEYDFMLELMKGENRALPILLIDAVNCKEAVSSIEKAPAGIRYKGQQKIVYKIKKSEKLAPKKLPMLSTNFSDAFKYLMMRKLWRRAIRGKGKASNASPYVPGFDDMEG